MLKYSWKKSETAIDPWQTDTKSTAFLKNDKKIHTLTDTYTHTHSLSNRPPSLPTNVHFLETKLVLKILLPQRWEEEKDEERRRRTAGAQSPFPPEGQVPNVQWLGPRQSIEEAAQCCCYHRQGLQQESQLHGNTECVQSGQWIVLVFFLKKKRQTQI